MFKAALAALLLASVALPAAAHTVYPGCSVPSNTTGSVWYVDPVNGKTPAAWVTYFAATPTDKGIQGDALHPWNSLQGIVSGQWGASIVVPGYTRPLLSSIPFNHVVSAGEAGILPGETLGRGASADNTGAPPVHPGDTIMLMSGAYGDLVLGDSGLITTNSDFVTIEAAPGQTPVLTTLAVGRTNKWVFNGIKVSSVNGTNGNTKGLVTVGDGGSAAPTTDILFEGVDISSTDDITGATWTQAQWNANGRNGYFVSGTPSVAGVGGFAYTTCISMANSRIHNVRWGGTLYANNSLFTLNQIDHFGDDGLDYGADNIAITHNSIHDNFDVGDGNHEDGLQGQIGPITKGVAVNKFSNVVIDSNTVIRQTDPAILFPNYLQGIDAFDSDWTNLTVTNNVVVTSACWGIDFASVHNGLFAGNTVADDLQVATPGCTAWLSVSGSTHEGLPSSNVRITNNLAEHFLMGSADDTGMTWDNNVSTNSYQAFSGYNFAKGVFSYGEPVGTDATGNVTPAKAMDLTTVFKVWSPATHKFDMSLLPTSTVFGHGSSIPATDILGNARALAAPVCTTPTYTPAPGAY